MRVWDTDERYMCYEHLNGMHHEIHTIYSVIANNLDGYANHPEVKRWRGHLWALFLKHNRVVAELNRRWEYHHDSFLALVYDCPNYPALITSIPDQLRLLETKDCDCQLYKFSWR
jgi:Pyrimidine dimer DNA glycosylase